LTPWPLAHRAAWGPDRTEQVSVHS
jgi:hypothetical protein